MMDKRELRRALAEGLAREHPVRTAGLSINQLIELVLQWGLKGTVYGALSGASQETDGLPATAGARSREG